MNMKRHQLKDDQKFEIYEYLKTNKDQFKGKTISQVRKMVEKDEKGPKIKCTEQNIRGLIQKSKINIGIRTPTGRTSRTPTKGGEDRTVVLANIVDNILEFLEEFAGESVISDSLKKRLKQINNRQRVSFISEINKPDPLETE